MLDWSEPAAPVRRMPLPLVTQTVVEADQTGLGAIDRSGGRVSVDDKRMINCRADHRAISHHGARPVRCHRVFHR